MSNGTNGLYRLGGASFVASGVLFLARSVLEWAMGPPPPSGTEILGWITEHKALASFVSEVLFFALAALVPAVVALYESLAREHRLGAIVGCGMFAIAIPLLAAILVVHGRLVFPVFQLRVHTPEAAELVVAIYYGGMHAVALLFAIGTAVVSVAMRGLYGKPIAYFGLATSAIDVASGYPDLIGPLPTLVCGVVLAAWFAAVGSRLYRFGS